MSFAKAIQRGGRRSKPPYLTASMSADLFESRRIVCARRMVADSRELISSREPFAVPDGKLRLLREIIQRRNIERARRRLLRSQVSPIGEELGPMTLKDGANL